MTNQSSESNQSTIGRLLLRFTIGTATGLLLSFLLWLGSYYMHVSIPIPQGVAGSVVLAVFCGVVAARWGFKALEDIVDSFSSRL